MKIGDRVRITSNSNIHFFALGSIVKLTGHYDDGLWKAQGASKRDGSGIYQTISEQDFKPVEDEVEENTIKEEYKMENISGAFYIDEMDNGFEVVVEAEGEQVAMVTNGNPLDEIKKGVEIIEQKKAEKEYKESQIEYHKEALKELEDESK